MRKPEITAKHLVLALLVGTALGVQIGMIAFEDQIKREYMQHE